MEKHEITALITQELPGLLAHDPVIREHIKELVTPYFALRYETESRFDQLLGELRQMREESERKWAEQKEEMRQMREESERKWAEQKAESERKSAEHKEELRQMREESERKWAEQKAESERKWAEQKAESERKWAEFKEELRQMREEFQEEMRQMREEFQEEMRQMREESERKWVEQKEETARKDEEHRKEFAYQVEEQRKIQRRIDIKLGAIGARCGVDSEASFRNVLKGILEEVAEVEVLNINEYDEAGEVFGQPEQVEMDIVIQNGKVIVCELRSSISKGDVALLDRKAAYYEKHHQRTVSQKVIISPMVNPRALPLAEKLGIKVYYNVEDASFNDEE